MGARQSVNRLTGVVPELRIQERRAPGRGHGLRCAISSQPALRAGVSQENRASIPKVAAYVRGFPQTGEFLDSVTKLMLYLLPHYVKEGKSYLTVAFGCTGGQHRSVMMAEEMRKRLEESRIPGEGAASGYGEVKQRSWPRLARVGGVCGVRPEWRSSDCCRFLTVSYLIFISGRPASEKMRS